VFFGYQNATVSNDSLSRYSGTAGLSLIFKSITFEEVILSLIFKSITFEEVIDSEVTANLNLSLFREVKDLKIKNTVKDKNTLPCKISGFC